MKRLKCFRFILFKIFVILTLEVSHLNALTSCPWIPTYQQSVENIVKGIQEKTGKKPTKSCGGGEDFKVCFECVDKIDKKDWLRIQRMLATPSFKNWHVDWHVKAPEMLQKKIQEFTQGKQTQESLLLGGELAGENFLLMHREIIRSVQANLAAQGLPCITGWSQLPEKVDDKDWKKNDYYYLELQQRFCNKLDKRSRENLDNFFKDYWVELKEYNNSFHDKYIQITNKYNKVDLEGMGTPLINEMEEKLSDLKEEYNSKIKNKLNKIFKKHKLAQDFFNNYKLCNKELYERELKQIQSKHNMYRTQVTTVFDPNYIKSKSLGSIGVKIAGSWHDNIHHNYGIDRYDPNCVDEPGRKYCQSLQMGDATHVNIYFYKLHGLVDHAPDLWLKDRGYSMASTDCKGKTDCYQWKMDFVGDVPDFVSGKGCNLNFVPPKTEVGHEVHAK